MNPRTLTLLTWIAAGCVAPERAPHQPTDAASTPSQGGASATTTSPDPTDAGDALPTLATDATDAAPEPEVEDIGGPGDVDPSDALFDDAALPRFELELSDDSFDALLADPDTQVEGVFVYEGLRYEPVGVRCKGNGSFLPIDQKCSLKIEFDAYADLDFLGLEELVLNNMSNDLSMVHERLAYRLFREHGVPAVRTNHATVDLNGELYGLFTVMDEVDEAMMGRWFADPEGSLYEVFDADFVPEDVALFELEYGVDDRAAIQGAADALVAEGPDALAAADAFLDYDQFLQYWAVAAVVGQFDAYPYSFPGDDVHAFVDPADGRIRFVPHGLDETLEDKWRPVDLVIGRLAQRCLDDEACAADFAAAVWAAQDTASAIDLAGYAADVIDQVHPWVELDANKPYATAAVWGGQDTVTDFITTRATQLELQLGPHP